MPAMHSEISHNLEAFAVRRRLDWLLESIRVEYSGMLNDLQFAWDGDTLYISFNAYGFDIESEVHVGPQRVEWDGYVPSRANLFRSKIQRTIHAKLTEVLKATGGENQLRRAA